MQSVMIVLALRERPFSQDHIDVRSDDNIEHAVGKEELRHRDSLVNVRCHKDGARFARPQLPPRKELGDLGGA